MNPRQLKDPESKGRSVIMAVSHGRVLKIKMCSCCREDGLWLADQVRDGSNSSESGGADSVGSGGLAMDSL